MKKNKFGIILVSICVSLAGFGAGVSSFILNYMHTQTSKMHKELTIETGTPLRFEDFFTEPVPQSRFYTDVSGIDTGVPGSYQLKIQYGYFRQDVILNVVDTTAPTCEVVPQTVYTGNVPEASETVTNVYDLAAVTIEYVQQPDTSISGEYVYQVSLKDASGNETIVDVPFTVIDDHTAPLIYGAHDIEGFVGEPVAYFDGVTVTDNYDPNPELTVDNSQVNNNMSSSFPLTYIATDENGNSSSVTVTISFRVKPDRYYEPEVVYELARQVIEEYNIYEEDMTDVQKAFRIFNWCHNYIHYIGTSDKSDWTVGAYDGLTTFQGDCFTYYAVCRALLDVADIPNMLVERYPITWSPHYWNLVYLDGMWYHCDACYAYYHEGYYFMYAYNDLNHSDHGYDVDSYGPEIHIAQDSIQSRVNYYTLEVEGT